MRLYEVIQRGPMYFSFPLFYILQFVASSKPLVQHLNYTTAIDATIQSYNSSRSQFSPLLFLSFHHHLISKGMTLSFSNPPWKHCFSDAATSGLTYTLSSPFPLARAMNCQIPTWVWPFCKYVGGDIVSVDLSSLLLSVLLQRAISASLPIPILHTKQVNCLHTILLWWIF